MVSTLGNFPTLDKMYFILVDQTLVLLRIIHGGFRFGGLRAKWQVSACAEQSVKIPLCVSNLPYLLSLRVFEVLP